MLSDGKNDFIIVQYDGIMGVHSIIQADFVGLLRCEEIMARPADEDGNAVNIFGRNEHAKMDRFK